MNATTDPRRFARLVRASLWRQRGALAVAALALAGVVAAELLAPWPLKILFDHVLLAHPLPAGLAPLQPLLSAGPWTALLAMAGAIVGIALLAAAFGYLQLALAARTGLQLTGELRAALFSHLQRLPLAFHRHARTGELVTKVASDTQQLRDLFTDWALTLLRQGVTVLALLGAMAWLHPRLALVVLLTLPPLLALIIWLGRRVKANAREQRRLEGRLNARLSEMLSAVALVQTFGRQADEEARFARTLANNQASGLRQARTTGAVSRGVIVLSALGTAITALAGAHEVLAGRLMPGELLVFLAYVAGLYKPVRDIARLSARVARASASAERVAEVLALAPEPPDAPDALPLLAPRGEIVFEDVSFAYEGDSRPVIEHLSLHIAAGERVALVGPSGAGKSTLVSLLLRLAEPTAGRILIDGQDIRRYTRASLRQAIGTVLQDPLLLGQTVRENIAYGRPDAPLAAVQAAARAAHAHGFISELPQGYDTVLTERGSTLSGGQRQRLCLARALVKEPAVLVMDEPTSAVDASSARLIHEALAQVHAGRTLLVIAHDYTDMARFDRVLVLDRGRLVEAGSHAALLQRRGAYLALVERRHA